MANKKTMTAALAIVKVRGQAIAKIKSLRITEQTSRGTVRGLGTLIKLEVPPVAIDCSATFDMYNVDLEESTIPGTNPRTFQGIKDYMDHILLMDGAQVEIYKKITDVVDPVTGFIKAKPQIFATITDMFSDSDSFTIAEGQVSDKTQSFQYLTPILLPV